MEALFHSITHRPYVLMFLAAFLTLGWMEQGRLRTVIWLVSGYLVAFVAEALSIRPDWAIPFGHYVYDEAVLSEDLLIAGVPLFDSLSFAFLSYVSFSFAQFFLSPLWWPGAGRLDVQRVTSPEVRQGWATLFLGAALMTLLDVVIDPLSHLGEHWFLGRIYHYPSPGYHFDIPLANYAGWFVVGGGIIFVNQRVDELLSRRERGVGRPLELPRVAGKGLFAPLFWAAIMGFGLSLIAWLGWWYEPAAGVSFDALEVRELFMASCFVAGPVLLLAAVQLVKPANRAREDEIRAGSGGSPRERLRAAPSADGTGSPVAVGGGGGPMAERS